MTAEPDFATCEKIRLAISDPGSVVERLRAGDGSIEVLSHWQARAAIKVLLSPPTADAQDREG